MDRHKGGIPLYYQVMRALKEQILSGSLGPGDRVPSESELMTDFGVSRVVVRRALRILEDERLIFRVKGKGTFVSEQVEEERSPRLWGYLEDLLSTGLDVRVSVLEFGLRKATVEQASLFGVDEGSDLFFVKRLRLVEERPFSVIENYLPLDVGKRIPLEALEKEPLMRLIETRGGGSVDWVSQVFQAVSADADLAALLGVDMMSPLLKMILTAYSAEGRVLDLAHVYFRSDRYNYRTHLKRRGVGESAGWVPVAVERPARGRRNGPG
jgi:GntR family transcriptional regulator